MKSYILRRVLQAIPVFLATTFLIYVMVYALPGDPVQGRCGERACPPAYVAAFNAEYNLDKPVLVQYVLYLGKLLQGDFGTSFSGQVVLDELVYRFPITAKVALIAIGVEAIIGIGAGVLAAVKGSKFIDSLVMVSTLTLISIPSFVIGSLVQLVFGVQLAWFPATATAGTWDQLIMPGIVLGSVSTAYVARLMRTNLREVSAEDYIRTAKAKGMPSSRIFGIHALRNALIPVITFIGYDFGALLGGAIVTERIFNIQGIGGFLFRSISQGDGAAVVGTVTLLVLVYIVVNLIVDLLYGVLDPRVSVKAGADS